MSTVLFGDCRYTPTVLMRILAMLLTSLAPTGAIVAQTAGVWSVPTLGYLFDTESRRLRAVQGVPGAASLEDSLAFDVKLESASIDPGRRYAILKLREGGVVIASFADNSRHSLESTASHFVVSPSGDAALFYDMEGGHAQIWTALATQPAMLREFDLNAFNAAAVTDDGKLVAVADDSGVRLIDGDTFTVLSAASEVRALAFKRHSTDLAAADASTDQVLLFRRIDGEVETRTAASSQDGIGEPVSVAFSASGERLLAANARSRSVVLIHLESQARSAIACECRPSTLSRAQGDAVFQISNAQDRQIFFFDGDAHEPRVFAIFAGGTR